VASEGLNGSRIGLKTVVSEPGTSLAWRVEETLSDRIRAFVLARHLRPALLATGTATLSVREMRVELGLPEYQTPAVQDALTAKFFLDEHGLRVVRTGPQLGANARLTFEPRTTANGRLPADLLRRVTAEHVWNAVSGILSGASHPFGVSTDYDLITEDGHRLAPKAVFGLAATQALGFRVIPDHFDGGLKTVCFEILRGSGFVILTKAEADTPQGDLGADDRTWTEGKRELVLHLKRERAYGASQAKKAEFLRVHGELFCEQCALRPHEKYELSAADACIEVHHKVVAVAQMPEGHRTTLADLECLCANCHRVVHRQLKLLAKGGPASASPGQ